jgi:hypothetical protein
MLVRRATKVVAETTMPRSATPRAPDFAATLWDRALRAACLVRLLAKERPRAQPEGPCEAGIGQRRGCQDRAKILVGRLHPATGSHLPSEETAPPSAVVPFASSPFAHPIPQSHRRASENLFSASQVLYSHIRAGLCKHELVLSIFHLQIKQGCGGFAAAPEGAGSGSIHPLFSI